MAKALDRFGEFVVANLRDSTIYKADTLLAAYWKSPGSQALQSDLQRLTPEQRAVVRRCVIASIDSGLHDFLFALQESHNAETGIEVIVDGHSIAAQSDGLHGEPYSVDGWFAKFSKHGPHPDPS